MLESFRSGAFTYNKLTPEEQKARGILGRLVGVIADFKNPTRNGRRYTEQLWDHVFDNEIMKEKIKNRLCFGELSHPAERTEVDPEKIAICLAEQPKKGDDGKLYGCFDILDTPSGRILKTLCDYGTQIGVSSRGQGDTELDENGEEKVIEDTYECECFDAVLIPAVKEARPKYVTESLQAKKSLMESLNKLVEEADEKDKEIMAETIKNLNLETQAEKPELHIDADSDEKEAEDVGSGLVKDLQEALKQKNDLESQNRSLQEKLSVSNAKEAELRETISKYRNMVEKLSKKGSNLLSETKKVKELQEQLKNKDEEIEKADQKIKGLKSQIVQAEKENDNLSESLSRQKEIKKKDRIKTDTLTERYENEIRSKDEQIINLTEQLNDVQKDLEIKNKQSRAQATKSNELVERYRKTAAKAVNKYIESQAQKIGVSSNEIKNKLGEHYTFDDIERICEDLQRYHVNVSKLPFNLQEGTLPKAKIKNDQESILPVNDIDTVDSELLKLAGL